MLLTLAATTTRPRKRARRSGPAVDPVTALPRDEAYAAEETVERPPEYIPLSEAALRSEDAQRHYMRCLLCRFGNPTVDKGHKGLTVFTDMITMLMNLLSVVGIDPAINEARKFYFKSVVPIFREAGRLPPPFDTREIKSHLTSLDYTVNRDTMLLSQVKGAASIQKLLENEMYDRNAGLNQKKVESWMKLSRHIVSLYQVSAKNLGFGAARPTEYHPETIAHLTRAEAVNQMVHEGKVPAHVADLFDGGGEDSADDSSVSAIDDDDNIVDDDADDDRLS